MKTENFLSVSLPPGFFTVSFLPPPSSSLAVLLDHFFTLSLGQLVLGIGWSPWSFFSPPSPIPRRHDYLLAAGMKTLEDPLPQLGLYFSVLSLVPVHPSRNALRFRR